MDIKLSRQKVKSV